MEEEDERCPRCGGDVDGWNNPEGYCIACEEEIEYEEVGE